MRQKMDEAAAWDRSATAELKVVVAEAIHGVVLVKRWPSSPTTHPSLKL
jgi:hypothetical protein